MMFRAYVLSAAAAMLCVGGCAANKCCCGDPQKCACQTCNIKGGDRLSNTGGTAGEVQVFPIPASELVKQIETALVRQGLIVASSQNGVIQTDWKTYEGEMHIARRWQERSRFRVSVIPDVSSPTGASRFELTEQTQRRSNEKANWEAGSPRPERAKELAGQIASAMAK